MMEYEKKKLEETPNIPTPGGSQTDQDKCITSQVQPTEVFKVYPDGSKTKVQQDKSTSELAKTKPSTETHPGTNETEANMDQADNVEPESPSEVLEEKVVNVDTSQTGIHSLYLVQSIY